MRDPLIEAFRRKRVRVLVFAEALKHSALVKVSWSPDTFHGHKQHACAQHQVAGSAINAETRNTLAVLRASVAIC